MCWSKLINIENPSYNERNTHYKDNMTSWLFYLCNRNHIPGKTLWWRHNGHDSISNHQSRDCLLDRLFRRRSKKTSKVRVTGLCAGNSPGNGEFPAQMAGNAGNVSIWWHHHHNVYWNEVQLSSCILFLITTQMLTNVVSWAQYSFTIMFVDIIQFL